MALNGVIALIFRHFTEFDRFAANYVTVIKDRPIMSAKYRLPVTFGQDLPTQQSHGLFATAKLLVESGEHRQPAYLLLKFDAVQSVLLSEHHFRLSGTP